MYHNKYTTFILLKFEKFIKIYYIKLFYNKYLQKNKANNFFMIIIYFTNKYLQYTNEKLLTLNTKVNLNS